MLDGSYFPAMLLLYILALWFAQGAAEESCEVAQLLQTWQKPGVTINGTEAEAVTSCAKKGCGGGCWFGVLKYAKDYECVYVDWFPLLKVEFFYCHDGKLLKCGSRPDATCSDFEAPNPCNPTSTSATTITGAGTTATTTATTTGPPPDLMTWRTEPDGVPICLTGKEGVVPGLGTVVGLPCAAVADPPTQLWEYTKKGEIVLHMNQLCLTAAREKGSKISEVALMECDGSESQRFEAKTDSWTSISLKSDPKCLYYIADDIVAPGGHIWLFYCSPFTKPSPWKSVPKRQRGLDDPVK
ncbi:hypothetical protein AK812_SmicGene38092 [Symbiodinium microadriaticum]|uniref:Ricin B lectin domain-containing protein n=1 Tax=Symbiodinium microadriaticum TaxID=2951 RepID=A0A1Q9CEW1_SYMMI|nr:hypothetical protein AK812_SmicGene38092 [Symbiodinium microadriaticum]